MLLALGSRLLLFAAGVAAINTVGFAPDFRRPTPTDERVVLDLPARWDTGWYVGLASGGYRWDGTLGRFENIAFFPAYPALLGAAGTLLRLPLTPVPWNWTGVALSTALFAVALSYLWTLAAAIIGAENAWVAVGLCALSPFSVYFGLPYTESLFLLAATASTLHMVRGAPARAALFGCLAGLTRPNGFLLTLVLLPLALDRRSRAASTAIATAPRADDGRSALWASLAPAAGTALYSAYVWTLTGHPFAWADAQAGWGRLVRNPWVAYSEWARQLLADPLAFVASSPEAFLNGTAGLTVLVLAVPIARRLGLGFGLFTAAGVLLPIAGGGIPSLGRYTAVLFPLYLYTAQIVPRAYRPALLIASTALAILVAGMFFTWRPMF
ncbi:MAG: hypothetical protein IT178_06215 [Acidobacteria bacterium]|nr:hypothetical protein [Acidobacteriota bacterium]